MEDRPYRMGYLGKGLKVDLCKAPDLAGPPATWLLHPMVSFEALCFFLSGARPDGLSLSYSLWPLTVP